jgi:LysM repeat protein
MNILKILGIVVAVHVVAFFLMFVNPGCRSTASGSAPIPPDTVAATATPTGGSFARTPPAAPAVSVDLSGPPVVRYSPTRPGSPAAQALESAPAADVTPATAYTVASGDSLWSIAKKHGTTVTELARANKLTSNSRLSVGQKLIIPGKTPAAAAAGGGPAEAISGATYVVKLGDTLSGIAHRVGSTPADIRRANNLTSDYVRVGQELRLPAESASAAVTTPAGAPAASGAPVKKAEGSVIHVVKPGETLGAIARKYQVKVSDLAVANNIADPKKIRPGQELVIPGFTAVGSAPATAAAPAASPPAAAPTAAAPAGATPPAPAVPAPDQDLDAGLKPQDNVPVIKIEDGSAPKAP